MIIIKNIPLKWKIEFSVFSFVLITAVLFKYFLAVGGSAASIGIVFCLAMFYLFAGGFVLKNSENNKGGLFSSFLYSLAVVAFCVAFIFLLQKEAWPKAPTNTITTVSFITLLVFAIGLVIRLSFYENKGAENHLKIVFLRTLVNILILGLSAYLLLFI